MNGALSSGESLSRLAHDLRGPALTVQGFASELGVALAELAEAAAAARDGGDGEALARRVAELLEADLEPCVECISSAATTLAERIDELETSPSGTARAA